MNCTAFETDLFIPYVRCVCFYLTDNVVKTVVVFQLII